MSRVRSFNPRTPCGVRPCPHRSTPSGALFQSTHSLRSATLHPTGPSWQRTFQSTHSLRSATIAITVCTSNHLFQSTHSLRSATTLDPEQLAQLQVSIHALLAECDMAGSRPRHRRKSFNPRTPCGVRLFDYGNITHDTSFNPRTPCGVRLEEETLVIMEHRFQSTHSLRSATFFY